MQHALLMLFVTGCTWLELFEREPYDQPNPRLGDATLPVPAEPGRLSSVEPCLGTAGDVVTIEGDFPDDAFVTFQGTAAVAVGGDPLTVVVPELATGAYLGDSRHIEIEVLSPSAGRVEGSVDFLYFHPVDRDEHFAAIGMALTSEPMGTFWDELPDTTFQIAVWFPVELGVDQAQLLFGTEEPRPGVSSPCVDESFLPSRKFLVHDLVPEFLVLWGHDGSEYRLDRGDSFYGTYFEEAPPVSEVPLHLKVTDEASGQWTKVGVPEFVPAMPARPWVTHPEMDGSTIPLVTDPFTLVWSQTTKPDTTIAIEVSRVRFDGATFATAETFWCRLVDDGSEELDFRWSDWLPRADPRPEYDLLELRIFRLTRSTASVPTNGAPSAMYAAREMIGIAYAD